MKTSKNTLVLDPIELIRKVKSHYGNNPIFPERIKEAKENLHLYQKLFDKNQQK